MQEAELVYLKIRLQAKLEWPCRAMKSNKPSGEYRLYPCIVSGPRQPTVSSKVPPLLSADTVSLIDDFFLHSIHFH